MIGRRGATSGSGGARKWTRSARPGSSCASTESPRRTACSPRALAVGSARTTPRGTEFEIRLIESDAVVPLEGVMTRALTGGGISNHRRLIAPRFGIDIARSARWWMREPARGRRELVRRRTTHHPAEWHGRSAGALPSLLGSAPTLPSPSDGTSRPRRVSAEAARATLVAGVCRPYCRPARPFSDLARVSSEAPRVSFQLARVSSEPARPLLAERPTPRSGVSRPYFRPARPFSDLARVFAEAARVSFQLARVSSEAARPLFGSRPTPLSISSDPRDHGGIGDRVSTSRRAPRARGRRAPRA